MTDFGTVDSKALIDELKREPQNAEIAFRLSMLTDTDTYIISESITYAVLAIRNDKSRSRRYKYFDQYMVKCHNLFFDQVYKKPILYGLNDQHVNMLKQKGIKWGMDNYRNYFGEYRLSVHYSSYYNKLYSITLDDGYDADMKGIKLPEYEQQINRLWTDLVRDSYLQLLYSTNIELDRCAFSLKKSSDDKENVVYHLYQDCGLVSRLIAIMEYEHSGR